MRVWFAISVLSLLVIRLGAQAHEDDFSEFEDTDEESNQAAKSQRGESKPPVQPAPSADESTEEFPVEDDDDEEHDLDFDHFQDSEEFEGHDSVQNPQSSSENRMNPPQNEKPSDLKIKTVPFHLGNSWSSYYMELLMMGALAIYFMNFLNGRSRNANIANSWLEAHRSILENNFALVGDDGTMELQHHGFRKEAEHCYLLWCSGRQFVEGMLVELRMIKRQCLVGVLGHMMRPSSDQVIFQLTLDAMEPMVFCLASKKSTTQKFIKDFIDISTYCAERKSLPDKAARDLGDNFVVYSEIAEVSQSILQDVRIVSLLAQFKDLVELLHISDQYSPEKPNSEEIKLKRPRIERTILLHVNLPGRGRISDGEMRDVTDLLKLCLYVADKVSRLKLSKESKAKAEKNRQKVEEAFLKFTHAQRQEMAQQRREERIRQERERILAEDDPDKQRRLEIKEQKRLAKKNTPKLKQMKVRAM